MTNYPPPPPPPPPPTPPPPGMPPPPSWGAMYPANGSYKGSEAIGYGWRKFKENAGLLIALSVAAIAIVVLAEIALVGSGLLVGRISITNSGQIEQGSFASQMLR